MKPENRPAKQNITPRREQPKPVGLNSRYLQIQDLRRLSRIAFRPSHRVEGHFAGKHATPLRGQSIEFRDYRHYMPGDDVGSIDWKVYGRSDRLFIRLFEHQSETTVHFLVDASASMGYYGLQTRAATSLRKQRRVANTRKEVSKYDLACHLAASLGFLLARQQDRFSFSFAQRGLHEPTGVGTTLPHLVGILQKMEQTLPFGVSSLGAAIRSRCASARRKELLIVFSDLLDDPAGIQNALAAWQHRGGEAILFQTLHADELELPEIESGQFIDSETGNLLRVNVADIRTEYRQRFQQFLEDWRKLAAARGLGYQLITTAEPYHRALEKFLIGRSTRRI